MPLARLRRGGWSDGNEAGTAYRVAARRLRATLFRRRESARNDNGGAAPRRNPLATSQPSGQPPQAALVTTTPECIPTALAIIERGDACIATRPTNGWGCLLVELLRSVKKNTLVSLTLSLSRSPFRSIPISPSFSRVENCGLKGGGTQRPMYRQHEGRNGGADKSESASERIDTDFSAWIAKNMMTLILFTNDEPKMCNGYVLWRIWKANR